MATEWWYEVAGEQRGPISSSELKALAQTGIIHPPTMVWRTGLSTWRPASQIQGLWPEAGSGVGRGMREVEVGRERRSQENNRVRQAAERIVAKVPSGRDRSNTGANRKQWIPVLVGFLIVVLVGSAVTLFVVSQSYLWTRQTEGMVVAEAATSQSDGAVDPPVPAASAEVAAAPRGSLQSRGPAIKGVSLGMPIQEAVRALVGQLDMKLWKIQDNLFDTGELVVTISPRNDGPMFSEQLAGLAPTTISANAQGVVDSFMLDAVLVRMLFKSDGMSHREFAQACLQAYDIPKLEPDHLETPVALVDQVAMIPAYRHKSPEGWEIFITGETGTLPGTRAARHIGQAIVVRSTRLPGERRFD